MRSCSRIAFRPQLAEAGKPNAHGVAYTEIRTYPAASLAQNAASGPYYDTARKITELYVGCLAAHTGTEVVLDSPTNSKGGNPDVIFKVEGCHLVPRPQR